MDLTKIDNIKFEGIDYSDWPDMCDTYIVSADYMGVEMTETELDELNEERDFIHEKLTDYLF